MANPALNEKRFDSVREQWAPGWAAPDAAMASTAGTIPPSTARTGVMTANGTFAKTFVLFLLVLAGGAVGWTATDRSPAGEVNLPGWIWICLIGAFVLALVCIFKPTTSPFLGPLYALLEGVFLGSISKAFESQWDGIVFQAILATICVFFATLALYVLGVVKVTKKFQMVVIGATFGILLLYLTSALFSLFGADITFWNEPNALGIIISVVICCVAALNLFLDYEFIRQASLKGAPKYMEWYGGFGIMVTLVWLYLEILRLFALLRQ